MLNETFLAVLVLLLVVTGLLRELSRVLEAKNRPGDSQSSVPARGRRRS